MSKILLFLAVACLAFINVGGDSNQDLYKFDRCSKRIPSTVTHTGGRRKKVYVPESEMLDCVDERVSYANETNAIKVLEMKNVVERAFMDFKLPDCDFSNWTSPACTLDVHLFNTNYQVKAEVQLNLKRLSIYAALSINDIVLLDAQFYLSKICVRFLPFLPKIGVCGHIYYFDCNFGSPLYVEACLTIVVADLVELRFYCIQLDNGVLTREDDIEPEEVGVFAVVFKKDRVLFEFNAAIPELLLELLGDIVGFITDAIIVIYDTVKSAISSVIDKITNFFSPAPRLR